MKEVRFHWPSHPWTRGSYASYLVGQWTTIAGNRFAGSGPIDVTHSVGTPWTVIRDNEFAGTPAPVIRELHYQGPPRASLSGNRMGS